MAQDSQALADAGGGVFLLVCIAALASLSLAASMDAACIVDAALQTHMVRKHLSYV